MVLFSWNIWILLRYFLTNNTLVLSLLLVLSTHLHCSMRQGTLAGYKAHGHCSSSHTGAVLSMSRKIKWVLTIEKKIQHVTKSSKSTELKLELRLRPWPQLFHPLCFWESPWAADWFSTEWVTDLGHTSFLAAALNIILCLQQPLRKFYEYIEVFFEKQNLKPEVFFSNQLSKCFLPGQTERIATGPCYHNLLFICSS